eukprot:gene18746-21335_t
MSLEAPQDILDFWFGSERSLLNEVSHIKHLFGVWFFRTNPAVETTFIAEAAQIDKLSDASSLGKEWFTAEGILARVVMLDQGTRTAFRGTPKAFAYDDIAKELVLLIIQKGWFFDKYLPVERQILCLPLLHSEDIHAHRVASELVHRLSEGTDNPELVQMFKSNVSFLAEHTQVVEKFGRYPSRNSALGRTNTPEEEEYLASPDLPGWAKSQAKA